MRCPASMAVMATGVAAMMIPSEAVLEAQLGDYRAAAQSYGVNPLRQLVELPCPGCPFAHFHDSGISWTKDQKNYLVLNISVSSDSNRLELNGAQFYPPPVGPTAEPEVLQIPADLTVEDVQTYQRLASPARLLRMTSWSLHAGGVRQSNQRDDELIKAHIQVESLEQFPINVPEIEVVAIKTRSSGFSIVKAEVTHQSSSSYRGDCKGWPMLCEWRQVVSSRVHAMKSKIRAGCQKMGLGNLKIPTYGRPAVQERPHDVEHQDMHRMHHHKKPHHSSHRVHHHHGHRVHHAMHEISRLILTIAIPILFGVLAGTLTYMLGLVIGTGMAMLWQTFRSKRQRRSRIRLEDGNVQEQILIHIKEGFEDAEIEVPPLYVEVE